MSGSPTTSTAGHPEPARLRRSARICRWISRLAFLGLALVIFSPSIAESVGPRLGDWAHTLSAGRLGQASGFLAEITSTPKGAEVVIDGVARGSTPFFGNVSCKGDQVVEVAVIKAGYDPWVRQLGCREGATLSATARLEARTPPSP